MTYPTRLPFTIGAKTAPTPPEITYPVAGIEISNLNQNLTVQWNSSSDGWHRHMWRYVAKQSQSYKGYDEDSKQYLLANRSSNIADRITIGSNKKVAFMDKSHNFNVFSDQYFTGEPWGRVKSFLFDITSGNPTNVKFEIKKNSTYKTIDQSWDVTSEGELVWSGYLDSSGYIELPYDKMVFRDDFFFVVLSSTTDVTLALSPNWSDFGGATGNDFKSAFYEWKYNSNLLKYEWETDKLDTLNCVMEFYEGHIYDVSYDIEVSFDNGSSYEMLLQNAYRERDGFPTEYTFNLYEKAAGRQTNNAKIRMRAKDLNGDHWYKHYYEVYDLYSDYSEMEGVFSVVTHVQPTEPTNLKISDTGIVDRTLVNRLTWKHNVASLNNRQGRAIVQWRKQGETTWNDIPVDGMNQFYDVPANTFPLGTIEWRVQTYNYVDMESPYSPVATFTAKDTPIGPTITGPIGMVEEPSPPVSWSHSYIQTDYEVKVLNLSNETLWETGVIESNLTSTKIMKYLANLTDFKIWVRVRNHEGLWSSPTENIFSTNYKFPAPAIVSATSENGYITISYDNPEPTGEQPIVSRNEVYKMIDNEWVKISDASPHSFADYAAANGVSNHYFVRSIALNGAYTDSSVVNATVSVQGVVLYLVNDPEGTQRQFKRVLERENEWAIETVSLKFKGRKYPVKEVGTMEEDVISFVLLVDEEEKRALDKIVYSGHIACYRDGAGRIGYGIFDQYQLTDRPEGTYEVQLELEKIDYTEGETLVEEDDGVITVVINGGEY